MSVNKGSLMLEVVVATALFGFIAVILLHQVQASAEAMRQLSNRRSELEGLRIEIEQVRKRLAFSQSVEGCQSLEDLPLSECLIRGKPLMVLHP